MDNKHEKILHTRVSDDIYAKISSKAKKHRVTVSNLVRNIVEDYLEIQSDVVHAVGDKLKGVLNKNNGDIVGYQPIILEKEVICRNCHEKIFPNSQAFVGIYENSSCRTFLCSSCREFLTKGNS